MIVIQGIDFGASAVPARLVKGAHPGFECDPKVGSMAGKLICYGIDIHNEFINFQATLNKFAAQVSLPKLTVDGFIGQKTVDMVVALAKAHVANPFNSDPVCLKAYQEVIDTPSRYIVAALVRVLQFDLDQRLSGVVGPQAVATKPAATAPTPTAPAPTPAAPSAPAPGAGFYPPGGGAPTPGAPVTIPGLTPGTLAPTAPKSSGLPLWAWIAIGAGAVLAIGGTVLIFTRKKSTAVAGVGFGGLESKVDAILEDEGISRYGYWWQNGLNVDDRATGQQIVAVLARHGLRPKLVGKKIEFAPVW